MGTMKNVYSILVLGPIQPPVRWVPRALSVGVKRSVREADHSLPSSAEVKNAWSYTCIPPIRLHGVVLSLNKHRDNCTSTIQFLVGKLARKRPLGRPRRRWEDNINMDMKEIGCWDVD
jgi:hypothetical protein